MQYTIRNIPPHVDDAIRRRARAEGRSLNDVAIEALERGMGVAEGRVVYRRLSGIAGTWVPDPETEKALEEQDRVDPETWE
jgi:plasmid stability protein